MFIRSLTLTFILSTLLCSSAFAEDSVSSSESTENTSAKEKPSDRSAISRITVAESSEDALRAAGSVNVIDEEQLDDETLGVDDIHRVLRQIPGVNIQEEDGYGLRPNIGFRGVPSERSAKITLMEDSILISPAPYSAPSAYYFPPIGRMESVEVSKGPGQIIYGPYTTGGALNLQSTSIPEEASGKLKFGVGNNNLRKAHATIGNSWKYGGVMLETYQLQTDGFKKLDNGGDTGLDLEDYQLKVRLNTNPEENFYQEVQYKIGFYDQLSNETYLGLTEADFGRDPNRRYAGSQLDRIDVDHIQHHIRHYVELSDSLDITTSIYHNETQRNWRKLEKVSGTGIATILNSPSAFQNELDFIQGADSPNGAFDLRDNQRVYSSMGIQSVVGSTFETGEAVHDLEVGIRFHADEEDRFQKEDEYTMQNGTLVLDSRGTPGSQANRIGSARAWSFFAQDTITVGDFEITPGLRYENIEYTRKDYGTDDENRTGANLRRNDSDVGALIPGISVKYNVAEELAVFAGVHKGFSPPGPTSNSQVKEEESVNFETGVSFSKDSLNTKAVLFYNDYDNLLGADTLSSGGAGTGDQFNGGKVEVYGIELTADYDALESVETSYELPVRLSYTYTSASFQDNFDSDFFGVVRDGDQVPYIADHQIYGSVGLRRGAASISFDAFFSDSMTTAAGEVGSAANTDSYAVFDLLASYQYSDEVKLFATVENLFDREYVVARRPAGARPGLPLTAVAGLEIEF